MQVNTMTEALTVPETPAQMRILDSPIGKVIPIQDIAELIGVDDSTITKKIKAFEKWLSPCSVFIPLPTTGGVQHFRCLNRKGLDRLLILMRPKKTGDESIDRLFELRESILAKLGAESKEIAQTAPGPAKLKEEMTKARLIAQETGGSLIACQKIALGKCGLGDYAPALDPVPVITHGETGWYNPTRLIALCNDPDLTPERLNYFLLNKGFQIRDGYLWRLTPSGAVHGREYTFEAPSGHREIRIAWRISILEASGLVRHPEQAALPGARV